MMNTAIVNENTICELSLDEIEDVAGGVVPFVLVGVAAAGLLSGAGIYLATEYLT